jgi:hypothetical protein
MGIFHELPLGLQSLKFSIGYTEQNGLDLNEANLPFNCDNCKGDFSSSSRMYPVILTEVL